MPGPGKAGLCGDISPVAGDKKAQSEVGCQGAGTPCRLRWLALTACPGCVYLRPRGGGISSRAAPFPWIGKGRGIGLTRPNNSVTEVLTMKRPLAYITAAWCGDDDDNMERAARYCRIVYEAGFSPVCPALYLPPCFSMMRCRRSTRTASTWPATCSGVPCAGGVRPLYHRGDEK